MNITQNASGNFETTNRGMKYTLIKDTDGRWSLWSERLAMGSLTVRVFNTLAEIESKIKAFRGIAALIN